MTHVTEDAEMALLFSSQAFRHNNRLFLITSIKHMQLLTGFLISLNKSFLFLY